MNLLLIQSSGNPWGIACAKIDNGNVNIVSIIEDERAKSLNTDLTIAIESTLSAAQWQLSDIDIIVVGIGPGSWTGLRIGITAAKTLAQSLEIPLVGIPTFDADAYQILQQENQSHFSVMAISPCRSGEIYYKLWNKNEVSCQVIIPESIAATNEISSIIKNNVKDELFIVSNNLNMDDNFIDAKVSISESTFRNHIAGMANLARLRAEQEKLDDALTLQPLYLAPSAAERNLLQKLNG